MGVRAFLQSALAQLIPITLCMYSARFAGNERSSGNRSQAWQECGRDYGLGKMSESKKKIKVTLVKSLIGTERSHHAAVRRLGLRGINRNAELEISSSAGNDQ